MLNISQVDVDSVPLALWLCGPLHQLPAGLSYHMGQTVCTLPASNPMPLPPDAEASKLYLKLSQKQHLWSTVPNTRTYNLWQLWSIVSNPSTFLCSLKCLYARRPHLEYGNLVWGLFNRADQRAIERVHRRAIHLVSSIRHIEYQAWLCHLKFPSLYYRGRCGDMIHDYHLMLHDGVDVSTEYVQDAHQWHHKRTLSERNCPSPGHHAAQDRTSFLQESSMTAMASLMRLSMSTANNLMKPVIFD